VKSSAHRIAKIRFNDTREVIFFGHYQQIDGNIAHITAFLEYEVSKSSNEAESANELFIKNYLQEACTNPEAESQLSSEIKS
jgi:hypothetical protein